MHELWRLLANYEKLPAPNKGEPIVSTFKVSYAFRGNKNALRTGALVIDAKDAEAARATANSQLGNEHDWHRLTAVTLYKSDGQQPEKK